MDLSGKFVLVTGASSGIRRALARIALGTYGSILELSTLER
jgi:NAD(P)-dependent dehydrogenase (short-subunit alcohol dehydrogenase family)